MTCLTAVITVLARDGYVVGLDELARRAGYSSRHVGTVARSVARIRPRKDGQRSYSLRLDVAIRAMRGHTTAEIAAMLGCSERHVQRVMQGGA